MSASIKHQIIERVLTLLKPLKNLSNSQKIEELERKRDLFLNAAAYPAIHVIDGAETPAAVEEDNRGYTFDFPLIIKLMISDEADPYSLTDSLVPLIQEALEADPQLNGLVNAMVPDGEAPFVNEITKPLGGSLLTYRIQYRRKRAKPRESY